MSDERAFVEAILEEPEDEATRLIFADWLLEREDPRGELLRLQLQLLPRATSHPARAELHQREKELLAQGCRLWRGFPERICREWALERGLARVTLRTRPMIGPSAGQVHGWLTGGWVFWVRLDETLTTHLERIAAQPWLEHVHALDLSRQGLMPLTLQLLLRQGRLSRLTHLDLSNNPLTDAGLQHLLDSPLAGRLRWLDLRGCALGDLAVTSLLESPLAGGLRWLDLHGNPLSPTTIDRLRAWRQERAAPEDLPSLLTNSLGMELVLVPAGELLMGSPETEKERDEDEGPQHLVELPQPFYMGRFHVTQAQWTRIMGNNPSHFSSRGGGSRQVFGVSTHAFPVEMVGPDEIEEFCRRLGDLPEEKAAGRAYRLPTEAEWEYACRAGGPPEMPFATGASLTPRQACYDSRAERRRGGQAPPNRPVPTGSYPPNAFGLFDMHGNVWDWCADWYSPWYYRTSPRVDPRGPEVGTHGVLRGGSWFNAPAYCRSASRLQTTRTEGSYCIGFRVVVETG